MVEEEIMKYILFCVEEAKRHTANRSFGWADEALINATRAVKLLIEIQKLPTKAVMEVSHG